MFSVFLIAIYAFAFFITFAQLSGVECLSLEDKKGKISPGMVIFLAVFALILRLIAAGFTAGHPTDMKCWTYWGSRLFQGGPWNFYEEGFFADYPPGYMYILWLIGSIVGISNPPSAMILILYKLPGIIGDICVAFIIYNIAAKNWNGKMAAILFFLAAFNPLSYFNSVIWGQIDSLLVLFALMALYALYEEKYTKSAVLIIIATLLKPQALMLAPVWLFAFVEKRDIKLLIKTVLICLVLVIAAAFPFSPALRGEGSVFLRILKGLNPLWLIEKYTQTLGSYNYASVNAFNFPALIGGNWKDASTPFLFLPWSVWGYLSIGLTVALSGVLYFKLSDRAAKIFVPAFFIIAFLYAFGTKMHERYIYPAIIFLLILYIFTKKRAFLWLFAAESVINLLNLDYTFVCAVNNNAMPKQLYVSLIALFQVAAIIASLYIIYHTYFKKSNVSAKISEIKPKIRKLTKTDFYLLGLIIIIYSAVAFTNLGDNSAPQTFGNGEFTIELSRDTRIDKIAYYYGIGDTALPAALDIEFSSDGESWESLGSSELESVFKWDYSSFGESAKFIRFTPNTKNLQVGEIGLLDTDGNVLKIKSSTLSEVVDEQELVPPYDTYENGTYFDEVYHPRSAYELLNGLSYYETTHPPLGKILISVGISIFGMTPFGWRFMGTLFGVLMLPALYMLLKKLFGSTKFAFLGTILFAFDFMHYSLTRMGTIDSYPVFFIIVMFLTMYTFMLNLRESIENFGPDFLIRARKKIFIPLLLCGIATGLGIASKWIAVYAAFGLAVLFFVELWFTHRSLGRKSEVFRKFLKQVIPFCVLCFVIIPFGIYLLSYIPVARCQNKGLFSAMIDSQKYMFSYHSGLDATHTYSSKWYQWPVVFRPLLAYYKTYSGGYHAAISIMGNPILWWGGIGAFFYSIYRGIKTKSRTVLFIAIGFAAQFLPWVFVTRCTFIYHFFAGVPFMIMLIMYAVRDLEMRYEKFRYVTVTFCVLCVLSFVLFYPVLTGIPVLDLYTKNVLTWFGSWVF